MTFLDRVFSWHIPPGFGRDATLRSRVRSPVALSGVAVLAGPPFAAPYAWPGHRRGAPAIGLASAVLGTRLTVAA